MLENPSDESVVRWGNDGDSFVVLEVRLQRRRAAAIPDVNPPTERKVHQAHPAQAL
jgi:osomolarity two-component system response regulator SKN7